MVGGFGICDKCGKLKVVYTEDSTGKKGLYCDECLDKEDAQDEFNYYIYRDE